MSAKKKNVPLSEFAHARSGDKGGHANVGVIAYNEDGFEHIKQHVTEEAVAAFFAKMNPTKVERFELPGIMAMNFLLHDILQGGASQSLRTDNQGKILALALLEMEIPDM